MKKFIYLCSITILAFQAHTFAQDIHLPADSVTKLLCKKWQTDYALVQGKKVNIPSSTSNIYLEFHKDGTFSAISGKPKNIEKGAWEYDAEKGVIFMTMKKDRKNIISLTKNQFAILADDQAVNLGDALRTMVYFKVKLK